MYNGRERNETVNCPKCGTPIKFEIYSRRHREFGVKRTPLVNGAPEYSCQCGLSGPVKDFHFYGTHPDMWEPDSFGEIKPKAGTL